MTPTDSSGGDSAIGHPPLTDELCCTRDGALSVGIGEAADYCPEAGDGRRRR